MLTHMAQEVVTPCCRRLRCRADGGGVSGVAAAAGRRAAGNGAAALVRGQVRPGLIKLMVPLCMSMPGVHSMRSRVHAFLLPCCRYAPLQERALWDGLAAIHNEA